MPAVVDTKPRSGRVTQSAADGEGDHELLARHIECASSEDEWTERHGRRKDGGQGDGEDRVALHPFADAYKDPRGDVFFEEGHTAPLANLMTEVSTEC